MLVFESVMLQPSSYISWHFVVSKRAQRRQTKTHTPRFCRMYDVRVRRDNPYQSRHAEQRGRLLDQLFHLVNWKNAQNIPRRIFYIIKYTSYSNCVSSCIVENGIVWHDMSHVSHELMCAPCAFGIKTKGKIIIINERKCWIFLLSSFSERPAASFCSSPVFRRNCTHAHMAAICRDLHQECAVYIWCSHRAESCICVSRGRRSRAFSKGSQTATSIRNYIRSNVSMATGWKSTACTML